MRSRAETRCKNTQPVEPKDKDITTSADPQVFSYSYWRPSHGAVTRWRPNTPGSCVTGWRPCPPTRHYSLSPIPRRRIHEIPCHRIVGGIIAILVCVGLLTVCDDRDQQQAQREQARREAQIQAQLQA